MMSDNEVVGRIKIELTGDQKVIQQTKALAAEQQKFIQAATDNRPAAAISSLGKQFAAAGHTLDDLNAALETFGASQDEIKANTDEFKHLTKAAKEAAVQVEKVAAAEKKVEIAATTNSKRVIGLNETPQAGVSVSRGGGQGFAGVVQRAAGGVGLGGVAEISGAIDDIGDLAKASTEAGLSAGKTALALGVAGLALGAIALAVKIFSDNLDAGAKVVQQAVDGLGVYYNAIQSGTSGSIQKQLDAAQAQKKLLDDQIATIENARAKAVSGNDVIGKAAFFAADVLGKLPKTDELATQAAKAQAEIDGLTRALNSSEVAANNAAAAYEAESKAIIDSITEQANQTLRQRRELAGLEGQSSDSLTKRASGLKDEIKATTEYLNTLQSTGEPSEELDRLINQAMLDLQIMNGTLNQIEKSALPAAKANEAYAKSLEESKKAADEYAANSRSLISLEQQRAKLEEDRARTDSRNIKISALEAQIGAAKEVEAAQEKTQKIVDLRKKAGVEETAAVAKYADEAAKVNREFMQNELAEITSYRKAEERATDQYATERKRKLEDLTASLSELASKGDVAGFVRAQRAGVTDINRGAEDFGTEARQRAEDFRDGVRQRQQEREAKLADLQASFVAERQARQANLAEQIAQETEAGKQRVLRSVELEKQLSALKEQFAAEDFARQRQQEDAAYQEQVKALTERNKQLAAQIAKSTDPVITAAGRLVKTVGDELNRAIANLKAGQQMARTGVSGGSKMHDVGALYTQPTTLLSSFAEKPGMGDAVIPFRTSEGLMPALDRIMQRYGGNQGGSAPVNVYVTTGSVASQQDLADVKSAVIAGVAMAKSRGK